MRKFISAAASFLLGAGMVGALPATAIQPPCIPEQSIGTAPATKAATYSLVSYFGGNQVLLDSGLSAADCQRILAVWDKQSQKNRPGQFSACLAE